jgi:hypothetical protein
MFIQSDGDKNIIVLFDGQENALMTNQLYFITKLYITVMFVPNRYGDCDECLTSFIFYY